jgi:hypothetical protein
MPFRRELQQHVRATAKTLAVYVTGWIKRRQSGVIGTNKADSEETVQSLWEQFRSSHWNAGRVKLKSTQALTGRLLNCRLEADRGATIGRSRRKFVSVEAMLTVAVQDNEFIGAK